MIRWLFVLAPLLAMNPAASRAATPDDPALARAKALCDEGSKLFKEGRPMDAARKFEEAYAVYPSSKLLYNVAFAYEKAGRPDLVAEKLEKYLEDPKAEDREGTRKWLAQVVKQLEKTHARVTVSTTPAAAQVVVDGAPHPGGKVALWLPSGRHMVTVDEPGCEKVSRSLEAAAGEPVSVEVVLVRLPGRLGVMANADRAEVSVDGKPVGTAPITGLEIAEGEHVVDVRAPGRVAWRSTVRVVAGAAQSLRADLAQGPLAHEAVPAPARPAAVAESGRQDGISLTTWGWITAGTGVAVAATGGVFTWLAFQKGREAGDVPAGQENDATFDDLTSQAVTRLATSYVLYGLGAVAVAGGAAMIWLDSRRTTAWVAPGDGGGVAVISTAF